VCFDFLPRSFHLPQQKSQLKQAIKESNGEGVWICKPSAARRGEGIFLFESNLEGFESMNERVFKIKKRKTCIVQQYIPRPLLVGGFKFDLRLYVLIPSFWPLRCYVFKRGLVRFGTHKFNLDALDDQYAHLTNSSINRHSPTVQKNKDAIGRGHKWTLERLFSHLKAEKRLDTGEIWEGIKRLVVLSLLPLVKDVPQDRHCYEILGYDVLLDEDGKAWLLEVNRSPAMAVGGPEDAAVKTPMLTDMFSIIGLDQFESRPELIFQEDGEPQGQEKCRGKGEFLHNYTRPGEWECAYPLRDSPQNEGEFSMEAFHLFEQQVVREVERCLPLHLSLHSKGDEASSSSVDE
jgi:tubulin polyglutamylase TTLL2